MADQHPYFLYMTEFIETNYITKNNSRHKIRLRINRIRWTLEYTNSDTEKRNELKKKVKTTEQGSENMVSITPNKLRLLYMSV